ncbi:hypothetical protein HRO26_06360 [Treponema pectinovorum]|uniref:calycin-like domain-containing protein n=1 Tax=Treponema pectinovorum TaxID=164 RepID=UPI003D8D6279
MKKTLYTIFAAAILSFALLSCEDNDDEKTITPYELEDIYGYTFEGRISASSGNTLTPSLTIYNTERVDWNMSTNSMGNNQFYYTVQKTAVNSWTFYWYSTKEAKDANDTAKAGMKVRIGINSPKSISLMVTNVDSSIGAGSAMAGRPVEMQKTSAPKNTTPTEINKEEQEQKAKIKDIQITVSGTAADWFENSSTYKGGFVYLVGPNGSVDKGIGKSGEGNTPTVVITKTATNTVKVKTPKMVYNGTMTMNPFEIANVSVKKDNDVYYLTCSEFTSDDGIRTINGSSLTAKLENGILTLRIVFKPGAMPYDITQIFTSTSKS